MAGILLPLDLEAGSLEAFREAMDLARGLGLRVELLHAVPPGDPDPERTATFAAARLQDVQLANGDEHVAGWSVRRGRPATVIADRARSLAPDLLVLRAPRPGRARVSWPVGATCFVPWRPEPASRRSWPGQERLEHAALLLLGAALLHRLWALSAPGAAAASPWLTLLIGWLGMASLFLSNLGARPVADRRRAAGPPARGGTILAVLDEEGRLPDLALTGRLARGLGAGIMLVHVAPAARGWGGTGAASALERFRALLGRAELRAATVGFSLGTGEPAAELPRLVRELEARHLLLPAAFDRARLDELLERLRAPRPCAVWLSRAAGVGPPA